MTRTINALANTRVWDLDVGDTLRGRRITTIQGVVGFAHNAVAVISFSETDKHPARLPAAYSENLQHSDEVMLRARDWIRRHGFDEGDPVDLHLLRAQVMEVSENNN